MGVSKEYQGLYDQIRNLEFRVKDMLDDPGHSSARSIMSELQRIEDEIEMNKSPRNIEGRVKTIQQLLQPARSEHGSFMSVDDAVALSDMFEDMRRYVRNLPSY